MPYIPQKDRLLLDLLIENLRAKTVALANAHEGTMLRAAWGYMRYIAKRVIVETSLNAAEQYHGKRATRYWLIVDHAGVASNIAHELFDRVWLKRPGYRDMPFNFRSFEFLPSVPDNAAGLNPEIDVLVKEVARISGPEGYNYDGAYCGMDNFSLTELLPRILLAVYEATSVRLDWEDIGHLIRFWLAIERELYAEHARPYEDEQIEKPTQGDVPVYNILLEHLEG